MTPNGQYNKLYVLYLFFFFSLQFVKTDEYYIAKHNIICPYLFFGYIKLFIVDKN